MATNAPSSGLLTVDEVAAALRCSRHSVYRAVARGELRALRVGANGPLRVRSRAVEQFLRPAGPETTP